MLLHITSQQDWAAAQSAGQYRGDTLATEGFIHCSTAAQVVATAERFYAGQQGLVLLAIDEARLTSDVRYELADNSQAYPHIYGALNLDAVTAVLDFPVRPDGHFELPTSLR